MRRLTVPAIRKRKVDGVTAEPVVMLTAYTARQAQLLDPHCDLLLVGDSLGQVIYGLPFERAGDARDDGRPRRRGGARQLSFASVIVDMPFGSYEAIARAGVRQRLAAAQEDRLRGA